MCSIGFGSVLAYFATIKVATMNHPHHRGVANAVPVSAYGLAALFYAFVSTVWFADNIEGLLKFIALFAGISISVSSLFIQIYDPNDGEDEHDDENRHHQNSQPPHLVNEESDGSTDEIESSDETEFEMGIQYLLKGHRGSFAQINNIMRHESSSSLFSDMTETSSLVSTPSNSVASLSRNSSAISFQNPSLNPIVINQSSILRSNSNISSSPLDFKAKQSLVRSGSFRIGSSIGNSPRNARWFGSVNQKQLADLKKKTAESAPLTEGQVLPSNISSLESIASSPRSKVAARTSFDSKIHDSQSSTHLSEIPYSDVACENNNQSNLDTDDAKNLGPQALHDLIDKNSLAKQKDNRRKKKKKKKTLTAKEHILNLLKNKMFLSHYLLNAFYCAIGQLYIFSIGFIVRAQVNYYRQHQPSSNDTMMIRLAIYMSNSDVPANLAVTYQALQVSIISLSNFLGRLISGPTSDLLHKKLKLNKLYVVLVSLLFLTMGQVSLLVSNKLDYLSLTSFLIGLAYGSIYGTMPSIVADLFGANNFATTWALIGTGPISVFLGLSDYFGTVYDKNSEWSYIGDEKLKMCLKGKYCYWNVFALSSVGCALLCIGYICLLCASKPKMR